LGASHGGRPRGRLPDLPPGDRRPKPAVRLSLDRDPLFWFRQWLANLRFLQVEVISKVPNVPVAHPFVERLIATLRREYFDWMLFWSQRNLEQELEAFQNYYNRHRVHQGSAGETPDEIASTPAPPQPTHSWKYSWQSCTGLLISQSLPEYQFAMHRLTPESSVPLRDVVGPSLEQIKSRPRP